MPKAFRGSGTFEPVTSCTAVQEIKKSFLDWLEHCSGCSFPDDQLLHAVLDQKIEQALVNSIDGKRIIEVYAPEKLHRHIFQGWRALSVTLMHLAMQEDGETLVFRGIPVTCSRNSFQDFENLLRHMAHLCE